MKKFNGRLAALLTAVLLAVQLGAPMALADEAGSVLHIATAEDWETLAQNCRLDAWSDGVTVILETDLELPKRCQIPTFGGTLEGGGHTLSCLDLTAEGDHQGLFRYLREGAVVRDLTVTGTVTPAGGASVVGGLVGSNSGTVVNCRFLGAVSGKGTVGGIAGVNELTGRLENCEFVSGAVSGEHFTGGVVGENRGTVLRCVNRGQINTQAVEPVPQLEDVDWTKLNRAENLPTCTDTGGIAGYSGGLLQSCTNFGLVGYPHLGYNVGGVAGRQGGQLLACVNNGAVRGRKDVGGIVGQAEPLMELRYQEDTLHQLARQLDGMDRVLRDTLDGTDTTRHAVSGHLSALTGQTGTAKDQISVLLDELESVGDETVELANDLGSRVRMFLDELPGMTGELQDAADRLTDGLRQLRRAMGTAGGLPDQTEAAVKQLEESLKTLDLALRTLLTGVPMPLEGQRMSLAELHHTLELLKAMLREIPNSVELSKEAWEQLKDTLEQLHDTGTTVETTLGQLEQAMGELSHGSSHLSEAFAELEDAIERQNRLPELELPKLSPDFHETEDGLRETLTALNDELEALNQTVNQGGDSLSEDLKAVSRQFQAVTNVLRHAGDEEDRELVVDLSEEDLNESAGGRLQDCRNVGAVEGDVNIGGVAGAMAIEFDFDPEDDIQEQGSQSLRFQYLTRAVVHHCTNQGRVEARKDSVGGIVGRMDMGVVWDGRNYGAVESTGGRRVGGIAGSAEGVLQDCWAKCALKGTSYVGGIAGDGMDIRNCRALVELQPGAYCGAIAGKARGTLTDNVFLSDSLGGVDGISYQGKAAPLEREAFLMLPDLPEEFNRLWIRFIAGERLVQSVTVPYGGTLTQLPAVPERAGYYGAWENAELENICFDQDIHAVYTPWLTAAASPDGALLAEGLFRPDTVLEVTAEEETGEALALYTVTLPEGESPMTALRIRLPEGVRRGTIWIEEDGRWQEQLTTQEGSYLRVEWTGTQVRLGLTKAGPDPMVLALGAGCGVLAVALLCILLRRRKKHSAQR